MTADPCALRDPDGTSPDGYACTLPHAHRGAHEAHGFGLGNVVASWPRSFESECAAELARSDAEEHASVQRGDAAPEEVADRRGQMRVVR